MSDDAREHEPSETQGSPSDSRPARLLAVGVLLVAAIVTWKLWSSHPSGWIPQCPTWRFLGIHCPGCGSTRSVHHLLNGRLGDALRHNALMIAIGVPAAAVYAWGWARLALTGRHGKSRVFPRALGWSIAGIVIAFALVRNIPGQNFDVLRPPTPTESAD